MALSGSFTGTTANEYIIPTIYWSATQSIADNCSYVVAELRYSRTNSQTTYGEWYGSITINGTKVPSTEVDNDGWIDITITKDSNSLAMKTPAIKVPHNSDGTKSITISASGRVSGTTLSSTTISGTITLDTIPKKATIVSAPNFNDEGNPTITYNNGAGNVVTTLQACISLDGSNDDIAYRDISKTGSSYTFNLTTAERNVLRNATTTANSRTVKFYVKTIIAGETYYSSVSKTLSIVNANPTLSPTVTDVGSVSITLTGDANNKIIKGYNNMSISIGAAALKGATIKSQRCVCGSKSLSAASGNLRNVESNSFVFTVTDSRGNTATKTITKTLIGYIYPTINVKASMDVDGVLTYKLNGLCYVGSLGAVDNEVNISVQLATDNDGVLDSNDIVISATDDSQYSYTNYFNGLDYRTEYYLIVSIADKIETVSLDNIYVSALPVFDWSKDDFALHVPTIIDNGKPIQGKTTDGNKVNMTYITTGNNLQIGGGAYPPNNIFINTLDNEGTVSINGKAYGANRVLWSGSNLMGNGVEIALSETISEQTTGILLVFSFYNNGTTYNSGFSAHFIPKQVVINHNGWGHSFILADDFFQVVSMKFFYVNDDSIVGVTGNTSSGTASGITYNNSKYVLRYVIGV